MDAESRRLTMVWAVLCLITLGSLGFRSDVGEAGASGALLIGAAALGAAFLKAYLVMRHFMELRRAPWSWRAVFAGWCVGVFGLLTALIAT
ncbi:MAG: cytochrome C oxidase subunit IV family protein [Pseudomonadota bacterium]